MPIAISTRPSRPLACEPARIRPAVCCCSWNRLNSPTPAAMRPAAASAGRESSPRGTTRSRASRRAQWPAGISQIAPALRSAYVAQADFRAAIAIEQRLLQRDIARQDRRAEVTTRSEMAALHRQNREFAAARDDLTAAIAVEHKRSAGSVVEADLLNQLAAVLQAQGYSIEAKQQWREAAAIYAAALAQAEQAHNGAAAAMALLGRLESVDRQMGEFHEAVRVGRRLLAEQQQRLGKDHPTTRQAAADLGSLYGAVEDYEHAKPLLVDSVKYWRGRNPPAPSRLAARSTIWASSRGRSARSARPEKCSKRRWPSAGRLCGPTICGWPIHSTIWRASIWTKARMRSRSRTTNRRSRSTAPAAARPRMR